MAQRMCGKDRSEMLGDQYGRLMERLIRAIECTTLLHKEGSKHMPSDEMEDAACQALTDEIIFCLKELGYGSFLSAEPE